MNTLNRHSADNLFCLTERPLKIAPAECEMAKCYMLMTGCSDDSITQPQVFNSVLECRCWSGVFLSQPDDIQWDTKINSHYLYNTVDFHFYQLNFWSHFEHFKHFSLAGIDSSIPTTLDRIKSRLPDNGWIYGWMDIYFVFRLATAHWDQCVDIVCCSLKVSC